MKKKLRYTPEAKKDLADVWMGVWSASKDFDIADQYINDLQDTIGKKKLFPFSGIPLYYQKLFTGYYSVNFKAYKAFYRINGDYLEVIRILPIKTDYIQILFDEENEL